MRGCDYRRLQRPLKSLKKNIQTHKKPKKQTHTYASPPPPHNNTTTMIEKRHQHHHSSTSRGGPGMLNKNLASLLLVLQQMLWTSIWLCYCCGHGVRCFVHLFDTFSHIFFTKGLDQSGFTIPCHLSTSRCFEDARQLNEQAFGILEETPVGT